MHSLHSLPLRYLTRVGVTLCAGKHRSQIFTSVSWSMRESFRLQTKKCRTLSGLSLSRVSFFPSHLIAWLTCIILLIYQSCELDVRFFFKNYPGQCQTNNQSWLVLTKGTIWRTTATSTTSSGILELKLELLHVTELRTTLDFPRGGREKTLGNVLNACQG